MKHMFLLTAFALTLIPTLSAAVKVSDIQMPRSASNTQLIAERVLNESSIAILLMTRNHTVTWGIRSLPQLCPQDQYIWAYTTVHSSYVYGANRIDFHCRGLELEPFHLSDTLRMTTNFNVTYFSGSESSRIWQEESQVCESHNGPMIGMFMKYQDFHNPTKREQGVLNFQGICWDNRLLPEFSRYRDARDWPVVNGTGECFEGYAICGFRTTYQVAKDPDAPGSEGTAWKNVVDLDFYCCQLSFEIDTCKTQQVYKVVARVDNRNNPKPTRDNYVTVRKLTVTHRVSDEKSTIWERSRLEGFNESFIIQHIKERNHSETNRKFNAEGTLLGLVQTVFDGISGLFSFAEKGVGKLLGAWGLGDLLEVPALSKLIGTMGNKNLLNLGPEGIAHFFQNTNFAKNILQPNLGALLADMNEITTDHKIVTVWAFYGYSLTLEHYNTLVQRWPPKTELRDLQILVASRLTTFTDMGLSDIMGVYGIAKIFGDKSANELLRNGLLSKMFRLGRLEQQSWAQGLGQIVDSENIGKLYNLMGILSVLGPYGCGKEASIEKLIGVNDTFREMATKALAPFQKDGFNETHFRDIVVISGFSKLLGPDSATLPLMFNGSELELLIGEDGLVKVTENADLKAWLDAIDALIEDRKLIQSYQALFGLCVTTQKLSRILGSARFQKVVGRPNFVSLIGSGDINSTENLGKLGYLYGLKQIFGNNKDLPISSIGPVDIGEVEALLTKPELGTVYGIYTIGQSMALKNLNEITGPPPPPLFTIEHSFGRTAGFQIPGEATSTFSGFLGGLLPSLLGAPMESGRVKNEKFFHQQETLTQESEALKEEELKQAESFQNTILEEITKIQEETWIETVNEEYSANALTLVLSPTIYCDKYYAIDIANKRTHVTIVIPNHQACTPEEHYVVVDAVDSLSDDRKSGRYFFVDVGTEWEGFAQFANDKSNIKDILTYSELTAGAYLMVETFFKNLTGAENARLKAILEKDLKGEQVWKALEAFEAEFEAWEFNFNMIIQLKLKCGDVYMKSSVPQRVRFPRVFNCKPKGVWMPLTVTTSVAGPIHLKIGMMKGSKDVNQLNPAQRAIPEVRLQIHRMLDELKEMFTNGATGPTNLNDVNWVTDSSLLRNPAWTRIEFSDHLIQIPRNIEGAVLHQLYARCGPIVVAMYKYKFVLDGNTVKVLPPDNIVSLPDDDCPAYLDC